MTTFYAKATEKELIVKLEFTNKLALSKFLSSNQEAGYKGLYTVEIEKEKGKRTLPQNDSLHLWFRQMAKALNEGGFSFKFPLGDKLVELDWNTKLFKENVWRPIQIALTGKVSTTNLDKVKEIDVVYEHLNRFFSAKPFFLHVPFPSEENMPKKELPQYPENDLGENKF